VVHDFLARHQLSRPGYQQGEDLGRLSPETYRDAVALQVTGIQVQEKRAKPNEAVERGGDHAEKSLVPRSWQDLRRDLGLIRR
jgi:hypothetical protein